MGGRRRGSRFHFSWYHFQTPTLSDEASNLGGLSLIAIGIPARRWQIEQSVLYAKLWVGFGVPIIGGLYLNRYRLRFEHIAFHPVPLSVVVLVEVVD